MIIYILIILAVIVIFFLSGIRIVRPTEKGVIETLGKYSKFANDGFNWIFPIIKRLIKVNTTERMMDVEPFEAITQERLNTQIDLVVFFKVKEDENSVKKSLYKVSDFKSQVVRISQTTARNVIGKMSFEKVNSERDELNKKLKSTLEKQSDAWGVEIVRVETKEITPPKNVQESMNAVLMAENEKTAAVNRATATETLADGVKRAKIKEAEGLKQFNILEAEGKSKAFELINKSFTGNSQKLKQMEVTQASLQNNSKIILTEKGINPQLIIGKLET